MKMLQFCSVLAPVKLSQHKNTSLKRFIVKEESGRARNSSKLNRVQILYKIFWRDRAFQGGLGFLCSGSGASSGIGSILCSVIGAVQNSGTSEIGGILCSGINGILCSGTGEIMSVGLVGFCNLTLGQAWGLVQSSPGPGSNSGCFSLALFTLSLLQSLRI